MEKRRNSLLNVVVRFIVVLTSITLIFRGMDISRSVSESLLEFEITRVDCIYRGNIMDTFESLQCKSSESPKM